MFILIHLVRYSALNVILDFTKIGNEWMGE